MSIADWPEAERPREKLLKRGSESLSDAELLAIFLRTGSNGNSAVDLARQLLTRFGCLKSLIETDLGEFSKTKGLGTTKFIQIKAAIELGQRYLKSSMEREDALKNPQDTRNFLALRLGGYPYEVFACLFLDNQNRVITFKELFRGTINNATVHPREVVKEALEHNAAALIFAHNHPSGSVDPSAADQAITRRLKEALDLIEIKVLDHIIIGDGNSASFAEQGLL